MSRYATPLGACLAALSSLVSVNGACAPGDAVSERPSGDTAKPAPRPNSFGLCGAPQNADDFASNPVPVHKGNCYDSQTFTATSNTPSTGGSCGGFTVAFGPLGDLHPYLDNVTLAAEWGDVALTSANCASARIAAVGWGARCTDDACSSATWEKIGGPQQRGGHWNTVSQVCYLGVSFSKSHTKYKTLNLDIIATNVDNGQTVRKRAKGTITARRGNGTCASASKKAAE